jgi:hypothetical protein
VHTRRNDYFTDAYLYTAWHTQLTFSRRCRLSAYRLSRILVGILPADYFIIRITGRGWLLAERDFQFWRGPSARLTGPRRLVLRAAWGSRSGVLRARRPGRAQSHQ